MWTIIWSVVLSVEVSHLWDIYTGENWVLNSHIVLRHLWTFCSYLSQSFQVQCSFGFTNWPDISKKRTDLLEFEFWTNWRLRIMVWFCGNCIGLWNQYEYIPVLGSGMQTSRWRWKPGSMHLYEEPTRLVWPKPLLVCELVWKNLRGWYDWANSSVWPIITS